MLIIGICGASGSGKTTLAEELMARLPGKATLIHQDAYYTDFSDMPYEDRKRLNFDHPDIFDHDLLYSDLFALSEGRPILAKGYDYTLQRRSDPLTPIVPGEVLVFEGIHAFYDPRVRELMDFKLFIKVDPDVCLLRRIHRDITERGRDIDGISNQYMNTVKPMYEEYIRGYEKYADVIVSRGGKGQKIVDILACYLNAGQL